MAIRKAVVEEFLSRKLENFDWIKDYSYDDLIEALEDLDPVPQFHTKPYRHQLSSFFIGQAYPDFLYLLDLGLGKSKLMLDLFSYERQRNYTGMGLVLVPNVANIENWVEQFEEHAPHLTAAPLFGQSEDRWRQYLTHIDEDYRPDFYILNYDGFVAMVTDIVTKIVKGKKISKRELNENAFKQFARAFDWVVFDESTAFKSHKSLTYRMCNKLAGGCSRRYALTGTPFGGDPTDLWSQFYVIDRGQTLGPTLGLFRAALFKEKKNYFSGWPEYVFDKKNDTLLHDMLKNRSIYYGEEECPDLPPKIYAKRVIEFSKDIEDYFEAAQSMFEGAGSNMQLKKSTYHHMRQLSSGFLGVADDETGEKAQIIFDENPKLDELIQIIKEMPPDAKMIIYHQYIVAGYIIVEALNKLAKAHKGLSFGYARLAGDVKDSNLELRRFKKNKTCRFLVNNSASGAFGLNLQVANYVVFFESPESPIVRRQAEKRAHRPGQLKRVFFFDLVMKGTLDQRNLDNLKRGKNLFDVLIKGKEKLREVLLA